MTMHASVSWNRLHKSPARESTLASQPTNDTIRIERLLDALEGVVSTRVIMDPHGRIIEIHILASHELHPKQIVRNVESALSAGLGFVVDRRVISVAQLRPDVGPITGRPLAVPDSNGSGRRARQVFVGFDTTCSTPLDASCTVTLKTDHQSLVGRGHGANTPQGRAAAAARATFDALAGAPDALVIGFEGAALVESDGRSFVLVAAHSLGGRASKPLTGVAAVNRSPEEAAILAVLQATNRFSTQP
jgi:hypothetical protein